MSNKPRLGVIHAPNGAANLREIYVSATGICDVVLIMRKPLAEAYPELIGVAGTLFHDVVIWDEDTTLEGLGLAGLTTFHDGELDLVDRELAALGLPGLGSHDQPWDKLSQRRRLNAAGASRLPIDAVSSPVEFRAAVAAVGLPAVLKPRRGVSGSGIAFIETAEDVAHQFEHRADWRDLLLEKMLGRGAHPSGVAWLGDFVSVETESVGAERRHVAVFDKVPVSVVRRSGTGGADAVRVTGDLTPSRLPSRHLDAVLDHTSRALDALGVAWRFTHTELWVSDSDVQVIEVNGRVGGHLNRVLRLVGGPDMVRSALFLALGREPIAHPEPQPGFAAGLFPVFTTGGPHVNAQVSRADLRRLPGVVGVDEVAVAGKPRADNGFRAANVTVKAADPAELDERIRAVHRGIGRLFAVDGAISDPWRSLSPAEPAALPVAVDRPSPSEIVR